MRLGFICVALAAAGIRVLGIRTSETKKTVGTLRSLPTDSNVGWKANYLVN